MIALKMKQRSFIKETGLFLIASCLAMGCVSSLSHAQRTAGQQKRTYLIEAAPAVSRSAVPLFGAVKIGRFSALPPFDSTCFVVRRPSGETVLDFYNGWIAAPHDLLRTQTSRYLEQTGLFEAVYDASSGTLPSFSVEGTLCDCFLDYRGQQPAAQITMRLLLLDERAPAFTVLCAVEKTGRSPLEGEGSEAAAKAFDRALTETLSALSQTLKTELTSRRAIKLKNVLE